MRATRRILASALLILGTFGCDISLLTLGSELDISIYKSHEDIAAAPAGARTWLPCLLPAEFTSYTEMHRGDATPRCGVIETTEQELLALEKRLQRDGVVTNEPRVGFVSRFRTAKTKALVQEFNRLSNESPWYRLSCDQKDAYTYFVDYASGRLFYASVQ